MEELSPLQKLDKSLKFADFYHVERCENEDFSHCLCIINLRYLYVQNTFVEDDSVAPLQKFCRTKFGNFHSISLFLCSLGLIEKKR